MSAKEKINEIHIVTKYIDTLLTTGKPPKSIYVFSKELATEESEFYQYFSSFKHLEERIFALFFENAISVLEKNEDFGKYDSKNKILSLYFTYIEILTANRSYVLLALKSASNAFEYAKKLKGLKKVFGNFTETLDIDKIEINQETIEKFQDKGIQEGFWLQFLMIIKYWMEDTSSSFEKTDLFIEKSVLASFDVLETKPAKSIIDLGKFLLKERMNFKM
ncbi:MAG: TetR family transcriptional regulator C-terminal domain-containing protein [Polaribacter sp.]|nr:TetR family transcriptional regulator C-terminal domain-containing protein [Polaribacter sp.]